MFIVKVIRRIPVLSAFVVLLSFTLRWAVVQTPALVTGTHPLPILILGVALLLLALFTMVLNWRGPTPSLMLGGSIVALIIVIWELAKALLETMQLYDRVGPGPFVALAGVVLTLVSTVALIKWLPQEELAVLQHPSESPEAGVVVTLDRDGTASDLIEGKG